ncbi:hypothetical protein HY483_02730 [Candidatus Woesearchaeota archaeon]|nr:hypothetical protein [Candidatus Woesearchaeota archaeon]
MLDFYIAGRALGFGERPGVLDKEYIEKAYTSIIEGLKGIKETDKKWKYQKIAHVTAFLRVLEFEVAYALLSQRFPVNVLQGMKKYELHQLFLRFHEANQSLRIIAQEERNECIDTLVETGFFRREWFDKRQKKRVVSIKDYQNRIMQQVQPTRQARP